MSVPQYRSLLENLPDLVFVTDAAGRVTLAIGNTLGILGYTAEEFMALPDDQRLACLLGDTDCARVAAAIRARPTAAALEPLRLQVRDRAGEARWVELALFPLYAPDNEFAGYQGIVRDVSEVARAERTMQSLSRAADVVQRASFSPEQVYAALTEQLASLGYHAVIALYDAATDRATIAHVSADAMILETIAHLFSTPLAKLSFALACVPAFAAAIHQRSPQYGQLSPGFFSSLPPAAEARVGALIRLLPALSVVTVPLVVDDVVLGVLSVAGASLPRGYIPAVAAFGSQMAIALRNAQLVSSLAESEAQYRGIFEAATDGLLVLSGDGRVVEANPAACCIYGYGPVGMRGVSLADLVHPDESEPARSLDGLLSNRGARVEARHRRLSGEAFPVETRATPLAYQGSEHVLLVVTDVTERKEAQQAVLRSERLRALGQMAGGIAHDFNNILVSIRGYADMALLDLEERAELVREDLTHIVAGARDAAEAVRRLQSLYREADDTSDFVPIQLDDAAREALELTRPHWRDTAQALGVTIRTQTELRSPPRVQGNPSEIRRLITNLIINAVEAMPSGGTLTLATGQSGDSSWISVADTGVGISPEDQARIFEPFFSTKNSSGLGLAVSTSIAERHGGELSGESAPGLGATFTLRLPNLQAVQGDASDRRSASSALDGFGCRVRALVVDDEPAVRRLLVRFLERAGVEARAVASGADALSALASSSYELLITDLGMPGITGEQLALEVHSRYPEITILLTTGWGETVTPEQLATMHAVGLLPKPFSYAEMTEVVGAALEAHAV